MAKKKGAITPLHLVCENIKEGKGHFVSTYTTSKNKTTITEKLERNKYCRWCKKHTLHKEHKVAKAS